MNSQRPNISLALIGSMLSSKPWVFPYCLHVPIVIYWLIQYPQLFTKKIQKNKSHNSDTPLDDHMLRSPNWSRMFFHGREVAPKKLLYVVNPGLTWSFATCRYPAKTTWLVLQINSIVYSIRSKIYPENKLNFRHQNWMFTSMFFVDQN